MAVDVKAAVNFESSESSKADMTVSSKEDNNHSNDKTDASVNKAATPTRRRSLIQSNGLHPGLQSYEESEHVQQRRIYKREALVPGIKPKRVLENSKSRQKYIEACEELRIAPSSQVLKLLNTTSLSVQHYGLRDKDGEAIARAVAIQDCPLNSILFKGNYLRHITPLCKAITTHTTFNRPGGIRELDLRDNSITDLNAAKAIGKMLASAECKIEILKLGGNKFKKIGIASIMDALAINSSCIELDLVNCTLGDGCGKMIGEMLSTNQSIRRLFLGWNNIYAAGFATIVNGLIAGDHVQQLSLEFNCIGNVGCATLSKLKKSKSLEILDISFNSISAVGVKGLSASLAQNKTLHQLYLDGNLIGDDGAENILQLLKSQKNGVQYVSVGCCGISNDLETKIVDKCKSTHDDEVS